MVAKRVQGMTSMAMWTSGQPGKPDFRQLRTLLMTRTHKRSSAISRRIWMSFISSSAPLDSHWVRLRPPNATVYLEMRLTNVDLPPHICERFQATEDGPAATAKAIIKAMRRVHSRLASHVSRMQSVLESPRTSYRLLCYHSLER